jgi:alpha-glucosidase
MLSSLFLVLCTCAGITTAAPFSHGTSPLDSSRTSALQARDADPNACPGYAASNVVKTDSGLTADLTLAGTACNVYSDDIKDLKLVVEYQSSK